jgi:dihydroorotase
MQSHLFRKVTITAPGSANHNRTTDVLVENGCIARIADALEAGNAIVHKAQGLYLSPGWMDLQAHLCDPGFEHRETLESGAAAAAAGGFTAVLVMPDTNPVTQTKSGIDYVLRRSAGFAAELVPAGALSVNTEGKDIAELYDMHLAGAKAFTDGSQPVYHSGLLVRALMYAHNFGGRIHVRCDDKSISAGGQMHEGVMSTSLGLKGIPALAEELMVARNIYLAEYAGTPIHLMALSTARSVQLVREAKAKGLPVTAAVHAANLFWTDEMLADFDTNYKVNPPLRSSEDRDALIAGLADGTISCITSGHLPEDAESKVVEFDLAHFGMLGLESAYSLARTAAPQILEERLVEVFCHEPRQIAGIEIPKIEEGATANFTLFAPDAEWTFEKQNIRSLSRNTPLPGTKLKGKVFGIYNRGQFVPAN